MSSFLGGGGGGGGLTIGTTPIVGGTDKRLFYDDAGVVNEAVGTAWDKSAQTLTISGPSTTHGLLIGHSSGTPTYNNISLNGSASETTNIGIVGGGGTDTAMYLEVPAGGQFDFLIGNAVTPCVITTNSLTFNSGTVTTSNPVLNLSQTWNNAAVVFTAIKLNVTNTAFTDASYVIDLQVGGSSVFNIDQIGNITGGVSAGFVIGAGTTTGTAFNFYDNGLQLGSANSIEWSSGALSQVAVFDTRLYRDAAGILAQRNGTNAQTLRVYNTWTDASNYERGIADWNGVSNVYQVGTEQAGTGSARPTAVIAGGTEVVRALTAGNVKFSNAASFSADGIVATVLGSLGPAGSNTTVQTWLTIVDNTGATRYIPCF